MKSKAIQEILKFAVVGAINTAIDLAVLNLLILISNAGRSGFYFGVFKSISFLAAVVNSYYMNKYWTFSAGSGGKRVSAQAGQFLFISIVGLGFNVLAATIFISFFKPLAGLEKFWPSVAALFGTVMGLVWNFLGYKYIVFKKHRGELLPPA